MSKMTWTCKVCGEERPDEFISVFTRDISPKEMPEGTIKENVRHCNDRPACTEGARNRPNPFGEVDLK